MIKFDSNELDLLFIPRDAAEMLINAPANSLRLYLYGLLNKKSASRAQIMDELQISSAELAEAIDYLQKTGVINVSISDGIVFSYPISCKKQKPAQLNELYKDADYNMLLQSMFGSRILKHTDYKILYECTELFGLSRNVVSMLVEYCISRRGERVPMRFISEEALLWVQKGITTIEAAQDYINADTLAGEELKTIAKLLGANIKINDDYIRMYEKWTKDWGLSLSVIKKGITETNEKANAPSLAYLNKVLESYHEKRLRTPADIEAYKQNYAENRAKAKEMLSKAGISKRVAQCDIDLYFKFQNRFHMAHEAILFAAEIARNYSAPLKTMEKIIENWHNQGAHTLEEVQEAQKTFTKKPVDYDQRTYSEEELRAQVYDTLAEMEGE